MQHNVGTGSITHKGMCLSAKSSGSTRLEDCNTSDTMQAWTFEETTITVPVDPFAEEKAQERCNSHWFHPHLGRRFLGGYNGYSAEFSGLSAADYAAVAKPNIAGTGPEIGVYGALLQKTWSTVGARTEPGEYGVHVDDLSNLGWNVGDEVAVTYSGMHDGMHYNGHKSRITQLDFAGSKIYLEDAVENGIDGGVITVAGENFSIPTEVMNLERSVLVTGDTDGFLDGKKEGLHTIMFGGKMSVDHTRIEFCGQRDVLARYCLHWHHVGSCPECKFTNNAIVEGQTKGITIHGTHDALVDNNVLWNARGAGIYIEDGNELHNTVSNNVIGCIDKTVCAIAENTAIYVVSYENNFINNRVSTYSNGIFFPGRGSGQGAARGKVCTSVSPYGTVQGNVCHHTIRFGLYVDNNFPVHTKKDDNGFVIDKSTCDKWTPDGRDNGKFTTMSNSLEWESGAIGQYTAGDIQYLRITVVRGVLYWKGSKVFANGEFAHTKDSTFVDSGIMGPSGQFTFVSTTKQSLNLTQIHTHTNNNVCN